MLKRQAVNQNQRNNINSYIARGQRYRELGGGTKTYQVFEGDYA